MDDRSRLLMATTAATASLVVSACGGEDLATEKRTLNTQGSATSILPTSPPTKLSAEAEAPVDGPIVDSTSTTPPHIAPEVPDSPEPQGAIAIWTNENDYIPLTGAAFDVRSCGENTGGGPIDMATERYAALPVSLGCWVVSLTRSPEGFVLNGPAQRTVVLDRQTTDVNVTYRFTS